MLEDKIKILEEIDDYSKPTKDNPQSQIIGTKDNRIDGILDRISLLKEDFDLEYMFNKGAKDNINIAKELEKGKVIIVKMLQDEFSQHAKKCYNNLFYKQNMAFHRNKINNFEYENVRDMQKYHSLNLIYYSSGYASFISKLPPPLTIKGAN
ncbi:hypothetical protein G8S55_01180 [Clostridium botulinum C]|uniref:hypothetical protein n=1 Tax=Clostridium botulinum TaxID=1491 RepID=UPI001E353E71|nr:hypothetical protein [Clostridium botulinum]MCD3215862.1 hypothetical protein [Clostridium botulinum C]MCD3244332.1 hypothetical protein [Clostridium botulinum C]MCD3260890.1 hypothetical protein [Clostridium botulinum C]